MLQVGATGIEEGEEKEEEDRHIVKLSEVMTLVI
jgi:hypothetical protein